MSRANLLALAIIWAAASWAVGLSRVQFFNASALGGYTDAISYLELERGIAVPGVRGMRVLVPALARAVPEAPLRLLSSRSDAVYFAVVRFALINGAFLFLTAATLYAVIRGWGFADRDALIGTLLFFTAIPVVQGGAMPMADPASWFFFALGVLATQCRSYVGLAATVLVGAFAKESVFLLVLPALLIPDSWRDRLRLAASTLPGLAAYFIAWRANQTISGGLPLYVAWHATHPTAGGRFLIDFLSAPNKWVDLFASFNLLWIPAIAALRAGDVPAPVRRSALFVPMLVALIFLARLNFGRILFLAFPIVLPLAVAGIRRWIDGTIPSATQTDPSRGLP